MEALGREQLQFARDQYAEMKPFTTRLATSMADAQQEQMAQARDYYNYQRDTFRPVEQGLVKQAQEFDTEAYRQQLASKAMADAAKAFQGSQGVMMREATRRGVNPASGAFGAASNANAMSLAAMQTGAANQARQQAEQLGFARKLDVVGLGRNLAGASTAAYGGATGAGTAAGSTAMSAGNQRTAGMAGAGTTMGNVLNSQTSVYNTAQSQADPFASIVGMGLGGWAGGGFKGSDIRLKMNIERVGTDERTQLPVYEFEYKANPGERFRGVMAHEVEVNFPEAVTTRADGYKAVFYERLGMQMVKV
jgi:hypothetical protein